MVFWCKLGGVCGGVTELVDTEASSMPSSAKDGVDSPDGDITSKGAIYVLFSRDWLLCDVFVEYACSGPVAVFLEIEIGL